MKITRHVKHLAAMAALLTVGLLVTGCASSGGKSTTRVYEERKFIPLYHITNTGDELNLKKGDAVAMACSKCKTVLFADVNRPRNRFFTPFEHRHYCPGCKSTITVTGRGFGAKEQVEHTCEACGSDSVFCCATQRGTPPTEGMSPK
jgi:Zn finger protein HypA/HybF involved in hydrogenase expression